MLVAEGPVAVSPTPVVHRAHRAGKAAFGRYLPDHVLPVPRPPPNMGQAEEVEVGPIRLRMACAVCHRRAEVDDTRLVRVEREPEPIKSLAQHRQDALSVDKIVERHHRIVGEADKGAVSPKARPHLGLEPFIQQDGRDET